MSILLAVLLVLATQVAQAMFIIDNQNTNPLLFIVPLDLLMVTGLFIIIERS
jgi:hypothetical protein